MADKEIELDRDTEDKMIDTNLLARLKKTYTKNDLLIKVLIGVAIGIISGVILNKTKQNVPAQLSMYIGYPGELFLNALQLIILPFIICCVIIGTTKLNISKNGSIAVKVIFFFFLASLFNVMLGTALGVILHPGTTLNSNTTSINSNNRSAVCEGASLTDTILDLGRNIIPNNIFAATFQQTCSVSAKKHTSTRNGANTLGLTFFFILFGGILGVMEKQKTHILEFVIAVYDVLQQMLVLIIWFTPVCVPCIICAKLMDAQDVGETFKSLGYFAGILIAGLLFYQLVIAQILYLLIVRKNPFKFYLGIMPAIMTGFATASKAASLPIMFQAMDKLKQKEKISQFVFPLGSMNLNGSAQYMAIALVFLAQRENIPLDMGKIVTLIIATTFASMSMAGVPSAAFLMLNILCNVMNIPNQGISLLYAIDWLLDRFRTATNILGDCYTVAIVEKLSNTQTENTEEPEMIPDYSMKMNTT